MLLYNGDGSVQSEIDGDIGHYIRESIDVTPELCAITERVSVSGSSHYVDYNGSTLQVIYGWVAKYYDLLKGRKTIEAYDVLMEHVRRHGCKSICNYSKDDLVALIGEFFEIYGELREVA